MGLKEVDFSGGESVYCINEVQLKKAFDLVKNNPESAGKINALLEQVESGFSRNERAALSFILVDRLLRSRVVVDG
jgi:hypothetical protein